MRAFFHQRCGQEFREPWTWVKKPACHTACWESGRLVNGGGRVEREYGLGRRRTDLLVIWPYPGGEQRVVIG